MNNYKLDNFFFSKTIKYSVVIAIVFALQTSMVFGEPNSQINFNTLINLEYIKPSQMKLDYPNAKQATIDFHTCSNEDKLYCRPGEVVSSEATWIFLVALLGFVFWTNNSRV